MNSKTIIIFILLSFIQHGCGVYSFTGASISPDIKTISIPFFINNVSIAPSNMSNIFTENLRDYFQRNTQLTLVDDNGDLQFDGYVSDYVITPVTANSSSNGVDVANLSRITISVNVSYSNKKDSKFDFDKKFSFFKDFDNTKDFSSSEQDYMEFIFDQIVQDIFNASVGNW